MMKFFKKWWIWLILIVLIILIILFIIFNNKSVGDAGINNSEFDEIQIGKTTNFEVNSIIDKNNKWKNNEIYKKCVEEISQSKEDKKYTYVYKYIGEKNGYAIITMQADYSNGKLYNDVVVIQKEKFNLK